jgi:predicted outer membrane protein
MLRRIPRFLRYSVLAAVIVAVAMSVFQSWSSGAPGTGGWTQTQWGPLGPADRDLLVKVRLAGLWEQPTGQQAEQQASSPEVREVGQHISGEHGNLDAIVRAAADKLGVLLPTTPSAQAQAWMAEISAQTGTDYDRKFVQRLREAHGIVLPLIAEVRVSTRNSAVREFAATANEYVSRHIGYLEGSGLVDYNELPDPPSPGLFAGGTGWTDMLVPLLVFVGALLAAVALVAAMRSRSSSGPRRAPAVRAPQARPKPAAEPAAAEPAPVPVSALALPAAGGHPPRRGSAPYQRGAAGDVSGPHRILAPEDISGPYGRAAPGDVSGPYRRPSPSDVSGPYRRPSLGETTGSRRRHTPGDPAGPRHSVRH